MTSLIDSIRTVISPDTDKTLKEERVKITDSSHYMYGSTGTVIAEGEDGVSLDIDTTPYTITIKKNQVSKIVEAKVGPSKDSISKYINRYSLKDDPEDVAVEIGSKYGWNQKQIERAEQIIRKNFIR